MDNEAYLELSARLAELEAGFQRQAELIGGILTALNLNIIEGPLVVRESALDAIDKALDGRLNIGFKNGEDE